MDHQSIYRWMVFCLHPLYRTVSFVKQILSPISMSLLSYALSNFTSLHSLIFVMYWCMLSWENLCLWLAFHHCSWWCPIIYRERSNNSTPSNQSQSTKKKTYIDVHLTLKLGQPIQRYPSASPGYSAPNAKIAKQRSAHSQSGRIHLLQSSCLAVISIALTEQDKEKHWCRTLLRGRVL